MTVSDEDRRALDALDARIRAILPANYQDSYQDVQPVSMGSAGLKYSSDGRVAWDLMWGSFPCQDLSLAGVGRTRAACSNRDWLPTSRHNPLATTK